MKTVENSFSVYCHHELLGRKKPQRLAALRRGAD